MTIRYTTSLEGVTAGDLAGFFAGWRSPPSPERRLEALRGSDHCVLAIDDRDGRVVGLVNALTDGAGLSAFIPLVEVLPSHRRQGIGTELLRRMLDLLGGYACVDLACDPQLQPFYGRCGMQPSVGMMIRHPSEI